MPKIPIVDTGLSVTLETPESGPKPTIPQDFDYNELKNQLECSRDSTTAMVSGTFEWEWLTDPADGSNPISAADDAWTAGGNVANPTSGDVIIPLPDQISGRWFRVWKKTTAGEVSYKTLPIQNRKEARTCTVLIKLGDVMDVPVSGAKIEWQYDTASTYFEMHGGKVVLNRKQEAYCDSQGAADVEIYRTSEAGYAVKFWFHTRLKTHGPFTKTIPDDTDIAFTQLVDA